MKQVVSLGKVSSVKVKLYDKCKYLEDSKKISENVFSDVDHLEIVSDEDAEEIERRRMPWDCDPYSEYCVIVFADDSTLIHPNSRVDVFKVA